MLNVDRITKNTLDNLNLEEIKKAIPKLALNGHFNSPFNEYFNSLIRDKVGDGFLVSTMDFRHSKDFSQIFIEVFDLEKLGEMSYILVAVNKTEESGIEISFNHFPLERINEITKETGLSHIYNIGSHLR